MTDRSFYQSKGTRKARGEGHERRAEILSAAERIFAAHGYEGATIRRIADEVGVSPTALYMHFPDKQAMLWEIGAQALSRLTAESQSLAAGPGDAAVRLRALLQAHLDFAAGNAVAYRFLFCTPSKGAERPEASRTVADYRQPLTQVVEELAGAQRLKSGGAAEVLAAVWASCHGLACSGQLEQAGGAGAVTKVTLDGLIEGHVR